MRNLLTIILLGIALISRAQLMPAAPAEMKAFAAMEGKWTGKLKIYMGQGKPTDSEGTMDCKLILNGRFFQVMETMKIPGMGDMQGMMLQTYDPKAKAWKAWWYDSSESHGMEMDGTSDGKKTVYVSQPTEIEGMGKQIIRSTTTKKNDKEFNLLLEMKQGETWSKMLEGDYTKK